MRPSPSRRWQALRWAVAVVCFGSAGFAARAGDIPAHLRLDVPSNADLAEVERLFDGRADWQAIYYNGPINRAFLERIGQCADLRELSLQPHWTDPDGEKFGMADLDPLFPLKKLEGLWLLGFVRDVDDAWLGRMVGAFPELVHLSLKPWPGKITERGFASLAPLRKLKEFRLYHTGLDGPGLSALTRALPQLEAFWAAYNPPDAPSLNAADLAALAEWKNIANLWLPLNAEAGDDALERIVDACPNLRQLQLDHGGKITPRGLNRLADLKQLHSLSLAGNIPLDDEGLAALSRLTSLTQLILKNKLNVTDEGLARIGALKAMYWLHLGAEDSDLTAVTDAGVARMAEAMPRLGQFMIFGRNRLGDPLLAALAKHPALTWLHVRGEGFTEQGFDDFGRQNNRALLRMIMRPQPAPDQAATPEHPPLPNPEQEVF